LRLRSGAAAALAAAFLIGCSPRGPGDAADLLATLPEDVDLVAFVDIAAVRDHPLFAKLREDPFLQAGEEPMRRLEQVTGLDPQRDFHLLVFAARNLGREPMEMVVLARGDLDRRRLERMLRETGWRPDRRAGLDLYSLARVLDGESAPGLPQVGPPIPGLPDLGDLRLAFLDDYTVAVGPAALLEATAAVREGDQPALVDSPDLGPMIAEGLGSGQFWGVFRSGYLAEALRERIQEGIPGMGILRGFSGIDGIRFSMRFSDSIDLVTRAHTTTEADAQLLADTLNGFLALAKLVARDQPDVLRFLEGTLVGLDLESVRLSMNVDSAALDRIRGGLLSEIPAGRF
jgi:hypothetical protein